MCTCKVKLLIFSFFQPLLPHYLCPRAAPPPILPGIFHPLVSTWWWSSHPSHGTAPPLPHCASSDLALTPPRLRISSPSLLSSILPTEPGPLPNPPLSSPRLLRHLHWLPGVSIRCRHLTWRSGPCTLSPQVRFGPAFFGLPLSPFFFLCFETGHTFESVHKRCTNCSCKDHTCETTAHGKTRRICGVC